MSWRPRAPTAHDLYMTSLSCDVCPSGSGVRLGFTQYGPEAPMVAAPPPPHVPVTSVRRTVMTAVKASQRTRRPLTALAGAVALTATSIGVWAATTSAAQAAALPTPDHVVVVVM